MKNMYLPFPAKVIDILKNTDKEYTFRISYNDKLVKPGQFFEVSVPKFGEVPISVSRIAGDYIELTIRKVGKVTAEIINSCIGNTILLRGPYGNGFQLHRYHNKNVVIITGGTGIAPARCLIEYLLDNELHTTLSIIAGFKNKENILYEDDFATWHQNANLLLAIESGIKSDDINIGLVSDFIADLPLKNPQNTEAVIIGPASMMKNCAEQLMTFGLPASNITLSLERKMCCGNGKCGHCRIEDIYVCSDGPVFEYTKIRHMLD